MTKSSFEIKKYTLYNAESRVLFDLTRFDESGGLGLQAEVIFDCPMNDVEVFITNEYLPSKGKDPRTEAGLLFFPKVQIGEKWHTIKEPLTWFMLIDEDEKFDILNEFLVFSESEVIAATNHLFGKRARSIDYTVNAAA